MTTWYSTAFTADGINRSSLDDVKFLAPVAIDGGRVAYKRAFIDLRTTSPDVIVGDELRMFPLKSGDRLVSMYIAVDGGFGANVEISVGLWMQGKNNDGPVVSGIGLFASAVAISSALDRTEILTEAANREDELRGLAAWEWINDVTPGTYGDDPHEVWDVVARIFNAPGTGGILLLELYYLPAGG